MIRKILLGSTVLAGAAFLSATPAAAQEACVTNPGAVTSGTATIFQDLACGTGSTATGDAGSGDAATAIGSFSTATGNGAVALGNEATAIGFGATALGGDNGPTGSQAIGNFTTALGSGAVADDVNSVALGYGTVTTAINQVAVGNRTISQVAAGSIAPGSTDAVNGSQINTIVVTQDTRDDAQDVLIAAAAADSAYFAVNSVGGPAVATGTDAIAIGPNSLANGTNSIAIGNGASNGGFANSVAIGGYTNTAANQVRIGGSTAATARVLTGVAAGTTTYDAVNFGQLTSTNNRVTALEAMATDFTNDLATLDNRVDKVYKRGKAGTAVAIAMSGNGFLPDKKINVTGNVGFYSGAYAAALQVGAILTDTVAFNAGVAKGFGGGKMGARAGFTLGW